MRNTKRQENILNVLSGDSWFFEVGAQPYSASTVTHLLHLSGDSGASINSVRTTLKTMVAKGLVTTERLEAEVCSGLGYISRELDHYWNASTAQHDRIAAAKYKAGAEDRQAEALKNMLG